MKMRKKKHIKIRGIANSAPLYNWLEMQARYEQARAYLQRTASHLLHIVQKEMSK